ncbi:MAG TPA: ornithine carbamoyltransferase [Thermodesulfovibrionales bacterium]|nr:ornithine carbamoyltransferase [Thermodesulfovibrionales bacterium]
MSEMKRDFLRLWDLSSEEIDSLLKRALELKTGKDAHKCPLIGRSIGLLFEKASTRTRISFEVGIYQLGAQATYMNPNDIQLGRGETILDTARVLSRYLDAVVIRTFKHDTLIEFASGSSVPIINGLSDLHHPCQALADLMTILEKKGKLKDIRLAYIGDGNNVANSLIEAASRMRIHITLACPKGYEPDPRLVKNAKATAKSEIKIVRDPKKAADKADALYTDVWVSMGQEKEEREKKKKFKSYQLNSKILSCAKKDAIVLHCLPAHRGEEITDEVMESSQSAIFDQAENRLHIQKALLEFLLTPA